MENKLEVIKDLLLIKASTKQKAYRSTKEVFIEMKETAKKLASKLQAEVNPTDSSVEVKFFEKSEYEMHLKFSGDTLIFMMHTNIFDFEPTHYMHQSNYIKEDGMRKYCGMIQIYNFLADSIKYNREGDLGYLVGRLFINKEKHILFEGNRPLSIYYSDIEKNIATESILENILTESILHCIHFDLVVPPLEAVSYISLEQKNLMSYSSGMPTGKMLGFLPHSDADTLG